MRLVGVLLGLAGVAVLLGVDLNGSTSELLGGRRSCSRASATRSAASWSSGGSPPCRRSARGVGDGRQHGGAAARAIATLPDSAPGLGPVAAVSALGILGTGVAFAIFYALMSTVGPARTFIVTYLAPGFAIAYGAIFLDEVITVSTLGGLALILGGSYLAAGRSAPDERTLGAGEAPEPAKAVP